MGTVLNVAFIQGGEGGPERGRAWVESMDIGGLWRGVKSVTLKYGERERERGSEKVACFGRRRGTRNEPSFSTASRATREVASRSGRDRDRGASGEYGWCAVLALTMQ